MKKFFTFLFILSCFTLYAQHRPQAVHPNILKAHKKVSKMDKSITGFEKSIPAVPASKSPFASSRTSSEVVIGKSVYDLQSNGSVCNRITNYGNGDIAGVWTMGFDDANSYPNRGTGFNSSISHGIAWDDPPNSRLESAVRTGWPNYGRTESGVEFIVNHVFTAGEYRLHYLTRSGGSGAWTEGDLPTSTPSGTLWPRMAVGGNDGESLHVIGITATTGLGASEYEGVNGHILYYRSTDAGASWDKVDMKIPGLDSSTRAWDGADAYAIDASGNTVVVAVFNGWNDVVVYRSDDNGETWASTIVHDFPLEKYVINTGYDTSQVPQGDTLIQPDPFAIETCDDAGAVLIDNDGLVHVFFGRMWLQDSDTTDAGWTYYFLTDGLFYWNELFGPDSLQVITGVQDLNGNGTLDLTAFGAANIGLYFSSLSSMPHAGVDKDNNIYVSYSSLMETDSFLNPINDQHNRHVYVMASPDQGVSWNDPYDVINGDIVDPAGLLYYEGVFPSIARHVDWNAHVIYQRDLSAGLSVQGDMDPADENEIIYIGVNVEDLGITPTIVNTNQVDKNAIQLSLSPNPAQRGYTQLQFELQTGAAVRVDIMNTLGQRISNVDLGNRNAGISTYMLPVQDLQPGMYLIQVHAGDKSQTEKLIVR